MLVARNCCNHFSNMNARLGSIISYLKALFVSVWWFAFIPYLFLMFQYNWAEWVTVPAEQKYKIIDSRVFVTFTDLGVYLPKECQQWQYFPKLFLRLYLFLFCYNENRKHLLASYIDSQLCQLLFVSPFTNFYESEFAINKWVGN